MGILGFGTGGGGGGGQFDRTHGIASVLSASAASTGSIILGFNVDTFSAAEALIKNLGIKCMTFDVIYDLVDQVVGVAFPTPNPSLPFVAMVPCPATSFPFLSPTRHLDQTSI